MYYDEKVSSLDVAVGCIYKFGIIFPDKRRDQK